MVLKFNPSSKALMELSGISEEEVATTVHGPSIVSGNRTRQLSVRWFLNDYIIFVDSVITKTHSLNDLHYIDEMEPLIVLLLTPNLPAGNISRDSDEAYVFTIVAMSFGRPVAGHMDERPENIYSGRWDASMDRSHPDLANAGLVLAGDILPTQGQCGNVWLFDSTAYRNWLTAIMNHPTPVDPMDKIARFAVPYMEALNGHMASRIGSQYPLHSEPLSSVLLIRASDGALAFYFPTFDVGPEPGMHIRDYSQFTMDQVASTMHIGSLRVGNMLMDLPPPPIEPIAEIPIHVLTRAYAESLVNIARAGKPVMAMVSAMKLETLFVNGEAVGFPIGRTSIWCPLRKEEGGETFRLFEWIRMEIWTGIDILSHIDLDVATAPQLAEMDAIGLRAILENVPLFNEHEAAIPAEPHAADILHKKCSDFLTLLNEHGHEEEMIHQWLNQKGNHIFLDAHQIEVRSKVRFGNKVSDFVVRQTNDQYTLIEIERANLRLFTKGNQERSAELNHACQQVKDWQQYVREHMLTVRETLHLPEIYEPKGLVILGRAHEIVGEDAERRWRDVKNADEPQILTYDDLVDRVRALAEALKLTFSG